MVAQPLVQEEMPVDWDFCSCSELTDVRYVPSRGFRGEQVVVLGLRVL